MTDDEMMDCYQFGTVPARPSPNGDVGELVAETIINIERVESELAAVKSRLLEHAALAQTEEGDGGR